jgi:hypothetical protein
MRSPKCGQDEGCHRPMLTTLVNGAIPQSRPIASPPSRPLRLCTCLWPPTLQCHTCTSTCSVTANCFVRHQSDRNGLRYFVASSCRSVQYSVYCSLRRVSALGNMTHRHHLSSLGHSGYLSLYNPHTRMLSLSKQAQSLLPSTSLLIHHGQSYRLSPDQTKLGN